MLAEPTMMNEPTMIRLRDGTIRAWDDDNELLPDGATLMSRLFLKDSAGSNAAAFDAQQQRLLGAADAALADYVHRLQNAWKAPDGPRQTASTTPITDAALARDEALRGAIQRQRDAWRRPA